ncbi:related to Polynucleotide 5'-hydroxyl-kinase GRC3 [Zygosaccharomyces bailii ISA1307]|nr:related to Polynucleotide 5'-hydroxyl-kinase GRC3 [Zygosaccharomyces bailii ISA1307]
MAQVGNDDVLNYEDSPDSDTSTSSRELSTTIRKENDDKAEYDDEFEVNDDDLDPGQDYEANFRPIFTVNVFSIDEENDAVLIGLTEKQTVFISGVFQLQVVKGGILYGHVHYNASKDTYTVWHPLSDSIPSIQSSFYAGWEEGIHIHDKHRDVVYSDLHDFPCIIKIRNAAVRNLMAISDLYPEVKNFWRMQQNLDQNFTSKDCGYQILKENVDFFIPLHISSDWLTIIEKLSLIHKNSSHDMRVIVLGGKNSGKSTLLRLLAQNFLYGGSSEEELLYLDLDPGQPEFSLPDCISLNQVSRRSKVLGKHMGQCFYEVLGQHYLGSNSPQDIPDYYLQCVSELINLLDEQTFMGTSIVNLPGWIKGFGLNVLNHAIAKYKPTHIIILESKSSKQYFNELNVEDIFESTTRGEYRAEIMKVNANFSNPDEFRFSPPNLRTFRMLSHFHTQTKGKAYLEYDFKPLVMKPPFQVSFGFRGIHGIRFFEEFEDLHNDDIKNALEGTVVGLYYTLLDLKSFVTSKKGPFPILKSFPPGATFFTLALVHSIDVNNKVMNIYLPEFKAANVDKNPDVKWILVRGKSETPLCEICPSRNFFRGTSEIPYISFQRRKKYEHIWKVRKNIMRRGYQKK